MEKIFIGHTGPTPLGDMWVAVSEIGLIALQFPVEEADFRAWLQNHHAATLEYSAEKVSQVVRELQEYAAGQRKDFELAVDWSVLDQFQCKALQATCRIPYGETRTYKDIALEIGSPKGARAVGRAEATNPMPVVLPCHRVIGSDRKLHGYGAGHGLETKTWLLQLEGAVIP